MRITGGWTTLRSIWLLGVFLFFMFLCVKKIDTLGWILGGCLLLMFLVDVVLHLNWKE